MQDKKKSFKEVEVEDCELLDCLSLRERKRILKKSLSFKFPALRLCKDPVSNKLCLESYRFVLYGNNTFYIFRRHFKQAQARGLMQSYEIFVDTACSTQEFADENPNAQSLEMKEINQLANQHFEEAMENVYGKVYLALKREHEKQKQNTTIQTKTL